MADEEEKCPTRAPTLRATLATNNKYQIYGSMQRNLELNICNCMESSEALDEPTILIVDDNMFNLIPLELILKELCGGLRCDKALNGEEAVNLFKKNL
jgi:hypothetical protein